MSMQTHSDYRPLFAHMDELLEKNPRVLLAIDGDAASGKTTLAGKLGEIYDCNILPADHFFPRPEQRTKARLAEPGGNLDYERFQTEVLTPLRAGLSFAYRPWNCKTTAYDGEIMVRPKHLNIIEGAYSQHPTLADAYHIKIFLSVPPDEQRRRIRARDGERMLERFETEWIPMEKRYFSAFEIETQCDFVFVQ